MAQEEQPGSTPPEPPGRDDPQIAPPMTPPPPLPPPPAPPGRKLLLRSDLLAYAEELGLEVHRRISDADLADLVGLRVRLIRSLPQELLVEIVHWANVSVRPDADKVELARRISHLSHTRFPGLSTAALQAVALLRGCQIEPDDGREAINRKIKAKEGFWAKFRRKRRALFGNMIAGMFGEVPDHTLPEEQRPISLKERIEQEGIVSGLKGKIRGVADDYIRQKLDEIETRIDRKLDEIDRRLADWRDKEIANRVRIIRITLIASVLVALLSLGYTYLRERFAGWLP